MVDGSSYPENRIIVMITNNETSVICSGVGITLSDSDELNQKKPAYLISRKNNSPRTNCCLQVGYYIIIFQNTCSHSLYIDYKLQQ